MKVLISGAGITGSSLAFWLGKVGHNVTVVERSTTLRTAGLQVDLRGQGIEVIRRMGLEQEVRRRSAPERGLRVVDKSGKQRGFFPANKTESNLQSFTSEYEIMRGDLCQLLHDAATKHRARYIFGTMIERFGQTPTQVSVQFTNGEVDNFDLLIGADGQWSQTRRQMLGVSSPDRIFLVPGVYVAYYTVPIPIEAGEDYAATLYLTEAKGVMTRRNRDDRLQVYIGGKSTPDIFENVRRGDIASEKAVLKKTLRGIGCKTDEFLTYLDSANDFYCERIGLVKLDSWSCDRVVLAGDAAYCPSVNTGMGTTSGIVGAYVLAGEIGRSCGERPTKEDIVSALTAYECTFRPFMDEVQKGVLEDGGSLPSGKFGIAIFNMLISVASFCNVNIAKWMIKENSVKSWTLPTYEDSM